MLRVTLAALAVTALLASSSLAGDCGCGMGYGSRGYAANAWEGYCDGDGNGCGGCGGIGRNSCGGCQRCCFPLIHNTLHRVGQAFDCLLPDPCCRRTCGRAVGCAQPTCGIEPGCGAVGMPADPFMDDHVAPTPTPAADARARSLNKAKMTTFPKAAPARALKPVPTKTASRSKVAAKPTGKSVLKVAYEEDSSMEEDDAPPVAPASIRASKKAVEEPARFAVKPVVHVTKSEPANPLRP